MLLMTWKTMNFDPKQEKPAAVDDDDRAAHHEL